MQVRAVTGVGCLIFCAAAQGGLTFAPLALSQHDDALGPGESGGRYFVGDGTGANPNMQAAINRRGDVIFRATDTAQTPNEGVWFHSASGGTNSIVALNGWSVGTYTYGNTGFIDPNIDIAGHTAWRYSANGSEALFGNNGSGVTVTAVATGGYPNGYAGFEAPDTGGAHVGTLTQPAPLMNSSGDNAWVGSLSLDGSGSPPVISGSNNYWGIWSGAPGDTHLRVRQGDDFPGAPGTQIGSLSGTATSLAFNGSGQLLFSCALQGAINVGSGSRTDDAILKYSPGPGLTALARRGDPAPGSPSEFYDGLAPTVTSSDMNAAGKVVFNSALRNAVNSGTQTAGWALFSDNGGTLTMKARMGDSVGTIVGANGGEFSGVNWGLGTGNSNLINDSGIVLFYGTLTGGNVSGAALHNDHGLFKLNPDGTIVKVMRGGDVSPGIHPVQPNPAPVVFGDVTGFCINALGQVVFKAGLFSSDIGPSRFADGLFAVDARGNISLVAQTTAAFEVFPGDLRVVPDGMTRGLGGVTSSGGEDGRIGSLSDNGVLVFTLNFQARVPPDPNPIPASAGVFYAAIPTYQCGSADFNCDGDVGTDADIESFFACLAGNCPSLPCTASADFNADGDVGTDSDIEAFFRVLGGGAC
jgi:hypothetical protein